MDWHTVWDAIAPLLAGLVADAARLDGVEVLGVDEHIWYHAPRPGKGPKALAGMVALTPKADPKGQVRTSARLLAWSRAAPAPPTPTGSRTAVNVPFFR